MMSKRFSALVGLVLILIGTLSLACNLVGPMLGVRIWRWGAWRLWPLLVVGSGLLFVLFPLLVRGRRGLGGLYIPGMPTLITGAILLYCALFNAWGAWEWLWPLEVLALALGFACAAIYMRNIWLIVPATIIGLNGLVLQFCAFTGLWEAWAVLWTIEPLSVGLALFLVGARKRSGGLFLAGAILSALAGIGLIGISTVLWNWWLINLLGPATLILCGFLLFIWGLGRRKPVPIAVQE